MPARDYISGWCRDKEHSTIIYESGDGGAPLLRLGWNKQDPRYMATILMDSSKVRASRFQRPKVCASRVQRPASSQQVLTVHGHHPDGL
jgi:DDB1- and CUL4-associated factor 7